ncbi:MAG: adenylate/guanylate cyclase domain-containing protein, partial [Myxococcota bacterium]
FDETVYPEDGQLSPGETVSGVTLGSHFVETDPQSKMLVNYYQNPKDYFPLCGIAAIIEGRCEALGNDMSQLENKVVIVGATALGTYDIRPTAVGTVPGVYIHAMAIQNMIDGRFLQRFSGIQLGEILLFLLTAVILGLVLHRVPPWASLLVTLGFIGVYYAFDIYWAFPKGFWLVNVLPTLQWSLTLGSIVFYKYLTEGREKRVIREAFQFYLTKSVVDEMLKDTTKLKLGGERRVCTVLFSDIRGFTTISESLTPEELSALLNEYLTPMTNLVFKYDGTLDKYMGDAIMAIFGAPVAYQDHATRACLVSLEMMEELGKLKKMWAAEGRAHSLDIGIGLNTGPMSVGNMGSEVRFDYTVMGDQVNLGSRLEGINKQYGTNIIISEFTYEAAKADVHARELDLVRVKGKNEPVRIYELLGKGKATGKSHDLIEQFEKAIQAYRSQNWNDAIALFERIQTELKPGDFASQMYIERCVQLRSQDMGPGWDGVFTMTTK